MHPKADISKSLLLFHYKNIPIFNNISTTEGKDFHIIISQLLYQSSQSLKNMCTRYRITAHVASAN